MKNVADAFTKELQTAQAGNKTSFAYIPHQFASHPIVKNREMFQVLVIGGSVYRSAIVSKDSTGIHIVSQESGQQPMFDTEATFLQFISEKVDPKVNVVGINFAYALDPVFERGRLDGLMVGGNMKDNAFAGLENKALGTTIEQYMKQKRNQDIVVSAANDTICLLLSGLTQYSWDQVAAGIVGTGMNFAIFTDKNTMINLESAHFDKFELSKEAALVDSASMNKGRALLEKEVAGAFLHKVFNEGVKLRNIQCEPLVSTEQIDDLAENGKGDIKVYANELLDRSASLVAAQVGGITQFLERDTAFVMEGSLFWKGYKYRERVERFVQEMSLEYSVSYIHIPDSGVFGGAKLVA